MRSVVLSPPPDGTRSPAGTSHASEPPLSEVIKSTAGDLVNLATAEVKLARFEIAANIRQAADRVGWLAAAAIPLLLGYLLALAALAAWLRTLWDWPAALATVAASQALIGGLIMWLGSRSNAAAHRSSLSPAGGHRHA